MTAPTSSMSATGKSPLSLSPLSLSLSLSLSIFLILSPAGSSFRHFDSRDSKSANRTSHRQKSKKKEGRSVCKRSGRVDLMTSGGPSGGSKEAGSCSTKLGNFQTRFYPATNFHTKDCRIQQSKQERNP